MTNEQFSLIMCELAKLETKIEKLEAKIENLNGLIGVVSKATVTIKEPVCAEDFSRFADLSSLKLGELTTI